MLDTFPHPLQQIRIQRHPHYVLPEKMPGYTTAGSVDLVGQQQIERLADELASVYANYPMGAEIYIGGATIPYTIGQSQAEVTDPILKKKLTLVRTHEGQEALYRAIESRLSIHQDFNFVYKVTGKVFPDKVNIIFKPFFVHSLGESSFLFNPETDSDSVIGQKILDELPEAFGSKYMGSVPHIGEKLDNPVVWESVDGPNFMTTKGLVDGVQRVRQPEQVGEKIFRDVVRMFRYLSQRNKKKGEQKYFDLSAMGHTPIMDTLILNMIRESEVQSCDNHTVRDFREIYEDIFAHPDDTTGQIPIKQVQHSENVLIQAQEIDAQQLRITVVFRGATYSLIAKI
jgi:hypothetical protein